MDKRSSNLMGKKILAHYREMKLENTLPPTLSEVDCTEMFEISGLENLSGGVG